MEIKTCFTDKDEYLLKISGRITTETAYILQRTLFSLPKDYTLILDLNQTIYISSTGLRVLLQAKKSYNDRINIIGTHGAVLDTIKLSGFDHLFGIEEAQCS